MLQAVEIVVGGDRHGGRGVERAGEDAEPVEHGAVVGFEELVRPLDRRPQRLMALDAPAALAGEQPEPLVEMRGDVGGAHRRRPARPRARSRAGSRPPVDRSHPPRTIGPRSSRPSHLRPTPDPRTDGPPRSPAAAPASRDGSGASERAHPHHSLTVDLERLPAGRQHRDARARRERRLRQRPRLVEEVLAVVQHQEQLADLEVLDDALDHRQPRALDAPQRRGDDLRHGIAVVRGRELAEPRPVPEPGHDLRRHLDRQARLAHTAGADEGHQRRVVEHRDDPGHVVVRVPRTT